MSVFSSSGTFYMVSGKCSGMPKKLTKKWKALGRSNVFGNTFTPDCVLFVTQYLSWEKFP